MLSNGVKLAIGVLEKCPVFFDDKSQTIPLSAVRISASQVEILRDSQAALGPYEECRRLDLVW
jgi:hypothetical protein